MNSLFCAESVAIIGVSESGNNVGRNVLANLEKFGYQGEIYAVGPRGGELFGHPIYHSLSEVPGSIELAIILTPARFVPEMLIQCGEKGIRWAVIESAGFRELGVEGEAAEREIVQASKRYGIRFVGPNCLGIVNMANGLCAPFIDYANPYRKGSVAVLSQSGALGNSIADRVCASGLGISKFVSIGNKLCLDEADYLAYLKDDPDTAVICFYLEDFKRGRFFVDLALQCSKPVILHKSNTSSLSSNIAQSHTAALAVDDKVIDAVCDERGILRVRSVFETIIAARGLSLPALKGNSLAVISRSGGHAVVAADDCARYGFQLPALRPDILDGVQKDARAGVIRSGNPLDLGDVYSLSSYLSTVEKCLRQDNIDGVVFIHLSQMNLERESSWWLIEKLPALSLRCGKPIAMVVDVPMAERGFLEKQLDFPFFLEPTEAVQALAIQYQWNKSAGARHEKPVRDEITIPLKNIAEWFSDIERKKRQPLLHEVMDLLDRAGIPTVPWRMTRSFDEALCAAEGLGLPVALKAVGPSLLHKSDKGAIALNVRDPESLRREWGRLQGISNEVAGIVVQRMAPSARELIIGGKRDPSFGPLVLAGLGGIMVEVMKDVRIRLAPIDVNSAMQMLGDLSGARMLGQFRGMQKADIRAAARIMAAVSLLMHHFPQISELDLNPVTLNDDGMGAVALDARLLICID